MKTSIIKDNKTGIIYRIKKEKVIEETLKDLPPVFSKLYSFPKRKINERIIDYFGVSLSYIKYSTWRYNSLPIFTWESVLLQNNELDIPTISGISPIHELDKIYDRCVEDCESHIVYVSDDCAIKSVPLFGSVIPVHFDAIIGIYKVCYGEGGCVVAVLRSDPSYVKNTMEFYSSKCVA